MNPSQQEPYPISEPSPEGITQLGWRQGCTLPANIVGSLQERNEQKILKNMSELDLLIVVSHDCDIANNSFELEPTVELVLARALPIEGKDASLFWGKNPRRFQFLNQSEKLYEISIHERFSIPRQLLLEAAPAKENDIGKEVSKQICLWLSKRYFRAAFPNSFNDRIRKAQNSIRDKLKKKSQDITAIYIAVSDEEFPFNQAYEIYIRATMHCASYEDATSRENAQQLIDLMASKLNDCEGIEVLDASVVSEAEISIDDLRFLKRWDYDYISFSTDAPDEIAPYC